MEKTFVLHKESGLYVARDGEVMWTTTYKTGHQHTWRTYGSVCGKGYKRVKRKYYVHRLVAETYISNPENKPYIDHINTNRSDNRVENLRWCTQPENCNNPLSKQHYSDAQCKNKKPVVGVNKETGYTVEFESATDAMYTLNIDSRNITSCCRGKRGSAGGYVWNYA